MKPASASFRLRKYCPSPRIRVHSFYIFYFRRKEKKERNCCFYSFRQKRAFQYFLPEIVSLRSPSPLSFPSVSSKEMNEFSRDKLESSHDQIWPHLRRQDSWESRLVREPATSTTDFVPPLCISARLCSVLEEAACNANSRYNCRPVHREADLDSSVSRTCQLAVTTPGIVATFALFHHFYDDFPIRAKEISVQLNPRKPILKMSLYLFINIVIRIVFSPI